MATYRLASLLSFFSSDSRIGFLSSFILSIILLAIFLILLHKRYEVFPFFSILLVIISYFYLTPWQYLISLKFDLFIGAIKSKILNVNGTLFLNSISSVFRYLILSTGHLFTVGTLLVILFLEKTSKNKSFLFIQLGLAITFYFSLIFSYTSIILYSVLFTSLYWLFQFNNKVFRYNLIISAVSTIVIAFLTGALSLLHKFYTNLPDILQIMHSIYAKNTFFEGSIHIKELLVVASVFAIFVILSNKIELKSKKLLLPGLFTLLLQFPLLFLLSPNLIKRFFIRGGNFFILTILLIFIGELVSKKIFVKSPKLKIAILIFFSVLSIAPLWGNYKMAKHLSYEKNYMIDRDIWETYDFLNKKIPNNKNILVFNPIDMQLIPVFTDLNLHIGGAEYLRSPEGELKNLITYSKMLEIPYKTIEEQLENGVRILSTCSPSKRKKSFKLERDNIFIRHLLYYPYVKKLFGFNIQDNKRKLTAELKDYLFNLYENANITNTEKPKYITLTPEEFKKIKNTSILKNYKIIFQNSKRIVFKTKDT